MNPLTMAFLMTTTIQDLAVRHIMSPAVVTLEPDMTLRDAIGVLDSRGISGAPVVARGGILGVLSASDVLAFEATNPGVPTEDDTRERRMAVGAEEPRVDETHPVSSYFTDIWDNAGSDVVERTRTTESPEWDVLGEHVVSEAMSVGMKTVQAETRLEEAAQYMLDNRIHRALVLDGERLVGVVTAMDFLRAIAGREGAGAATAQREFRQRRGQSQPQPRRVTSRTRR
ncbi:MAG TPA: CBS domain-containing protein [Gemmatimonadales bacterium]|nr:CBS domain-containing protein [Gemmatimonadales bacterium]